MTHSFLSVKGLAVYKGLSGGSSNYFGSTVFCAVVYVVVFWVSHSVLYLDLLNLSRSLFCISCVLLWFQLFCKFDSIYNTKIPIYVLWNCWKIIINGCEVFRDCEGENVVS